MINLNTQAVFEKITTHLHLNADRFLKIVALARECGHMTLRISCRPILILKVTKWQTGEDFHDLKQVFCCFLTIIQYLGVTHSLDG